MKPNNRAESRPEMSDAKPWDKAIRGMARDIWENCNTQERFEYELHKWLDPTLGAINNGLLGCDREREQLRREFAKWLR